MSSTSTQELVSTAVQSSLENTDAVTKLYLKLRQDALETYNTIQKELAQDGAASLQSLLKLELLRFEKDKMLLEYSAHIDRMVAELQFDDASSTSALARINQDYDRLRTENTSVEDEIQRLQHIQGPVLEKMHLLVASYSHILSGKGIREDEKDKGKQDVRMSQDNCKFSSTTLQDSVADIRDELIDVCGQQSLSLRQMRDIDVSAHLGRMLESATGFKLLEDDTYLYKKDTNLAKDLGDASVPMTELEQTIEGLKGDIIALVEETQQSKESWMKNARILELLQFPEEDRMEVD